jgi:hypothetical protein
VISGYDVRADWYRNVLAHPAVTLQTGRVVRPATAVVLSADEGAAFMAQYAPRHAAMAKRIWRSIGVEIDGSAAWYRAAGARIPFVRFEPR